MKKEAGIAERKLLARNERILNLEQLLQDADRRLVQQNVKFEGQLVAMKERIEAAKCESSFPLFSSLFSPHLLNFGLLLLFHSSTRSCSFLQQRTNREAHSRRRRRRRSAHSTIWIFRYLGDVSLDSWISSLSSPRRGWSYQCVGEEGFLVLQCVSKLRSGLPRFVRSRRRGSSGFESAPAPRSSSHILAYPSSSSSPSSLPSGLYLSPLTFRLVDPFFLPSCSPSFTTNRVPIPSLTTSLPPLRFLPSFFTWAS